MKNIIVSISLSLLFPLSSFAVDPAVFDDFEDGTTENWVIGEGSQPTNIPDGGPGGAGDNYLQTISTGTSGPGSRMVVFNEAQWTGDYVALGSEVKISLMVANFGASLLNIRIAVERTSQTFTLGSGGQFASTTAFTLPADGVWRSATFTLSDAEMTSVGGVDTLAEVLADVAHFRVLSSVVPAWRGDVIAGTLGMDDIDITQLPVEVESFSVD